MFDAGTVYVAFPVNCTEPTGSYPCQSGLARSLAVSENAGS